VSRRAETTATRKGQPTPAGLLEKLMAEVRTEFRSDVLVFEVSDPIFGGSPCQVRGSEVKQLAEHVRTHVVVRRNARGGRSAVENFITALRCLYNHAVADGHVIEADNPARKVDKPRRLTNTRRAVPDTRLAEINQIAASTGNDPALDTLLLRLHTETACRRGGALALRPADLDPDQCLILLHEKARAVGRPSGTVHCHGSARTAVT
jgi:integrase